MWRVPISEALDGARVVSRTGRDRGAGPRWHGPVSDRGGTYVTLSDDQVLDTARADPHTFVRPTRIRW